MKFLVNLVIVLLVIPVNIKKIANLLIKFINDIKDKGLSPDQYVRGLALFVYVLKEQKYINDFGKNSRRYY